MDFVTDLAAAIAITTGLTSVIKTAIQSESFNRFAPLVSLIIGVGIARIAMGFYPEALMYGIVVGLSASGLYSGVKSVAGIK